MSIVNGYATLAQFKALKRIDSLSTDDDAAIEDFITRASRLIDNVTGKWFYAATMTRYFDYESSQFVCLDAPLISITTLTNGDGTTIASTEYDLLPLNWPSKNQVKIKLSSSSYFVPSANGNITGVISIAGSWGYVDRTATTPEAYRIIYNTEFAALEIAYQWYEERFGNNSGGSVQVTGAGVVITPYGKIPLAAWQAISSYASLV